MKTNVDYEKMTSMQLREQCKNNSITGYGKMTKDQMISELNKKTVIVKEPELVKDPDEKIWTDRHMIPLEKGVRVNARINARWFQGTVVNFKEIEGEEHVSVLLDGKEISKLFHSTDVEILVGMKSGKIDIVPEVPEEVFAPSKTVSPEKVEIVKSNEPKPKAEVPEGFIASGVAVVIEKSDSTIVEGEVIDLKYNLKGVPFYRLKVDGKVICRVPKFVKEK